MNTDDEIGFEEEEEQQAPPQETPADQGGEGGAGAPTEADKTAALQAQVTELLGKQSVIDRIAPLAEAWLAKQAAAGESSSAPDPAALATYGRQLQDAILTKTPEEAGAFLIQTLDSISKRNINAEAARLGGPLAEKAANYTVAAFLSDKRDELGDGKAKAHDAIAKSFRKSLTPEELGWLGTANNAQAQQYLDNKYRAVAGDMWLNAPTKPKAPDMGGGGMGGGGAQGGAFGNVPAKEQSRLKALIKEFWPDKPAQGVPGSASFVAAVDNSQLRAVKLREAIESAGVGA